ncbi:MAG: adenovirus L4-33K/L4-22K family protein, partial [Chitinophagaceae bacterium]
MKKNDSQNNVKAGSYTLVTCGLLAFLMFAISWSNPDPVIPPSEQGIEVNLGNSDEGLGEVAPLLPGPPSNEKEEINTPPKSQLTENEMVRDIETNDNDKEAPDVSLPKPAVSTPKSFKLPTKENAVPIKKTDAKPQIVDNPQPQVKRPIAVYKGGVNTRTGGNNADGWNASRNQGIAGGTGDQGKINGNPDSDSYTGNTGTGKGGVSISRGLQGRKINRLPSFEDEFNENAKVAVDIRVDANGNVISANYQAKGSTTSDPGMRNIALQKAKQLK